MLFNVSSWSTLRPKFCLFIAWENEPILHGFQVQNIISPNWLVMYALEFSIKSYVSFNFIASQVFVCTS